MVCLWRTPVFLPRGGHSSLLDPVSLVRTIRGSFQPSELCSVRLTCEAQHVKHPGNRGPFSSISGPLGPSGPAWLGPLDALGFHPPTLSRSYRFTICPLYLDPDWMHGLADSLPHLPLLTGGVGEGGDVKQGDDLSALQPYVHYDEKCCLHEKE